MLDKVFKPNHWRTLGNTGISVSPLGLGTVKFGRNSQVKYPHRFKIPDQATLGRLLDKAQALGINLLDTAPAYGDSEAKLGRLLQSRQQHWVVSTKVGEYYRNGKSYYDFSATMVQKSVENSLRLLGVNVLDVVLVHSNGQDEKIIQQTDIIAALNRLKQKGWVRAIGFSGKSATATMLALTELDIFMLTLNQQDLSQAKLLAACQTAGKGVLIKKALTSGHTLDPAVALNFAVNYPGVTSVIVGTINAVHLVDNVKALRLSLR